MAPLPASDSPSPITSRSDDSILSGGGGFRSAKEGGTSRGAAAPAASGGKRVTFATDVVVRPFRPASSAAAAAAASTSGREVGGSRQSSARPTTDTATATARSSSSASIRKRDRGGRGAGPSAGIISLFPPTTTSAPIATATNVRAAAATTKSTVAAAARRIGTSKKGKKRQRGPIHVKGGGVLPNRKGKATGHPSLPDHAKSLSASDDSDGWTPEGLKKHGDTLPETKDEEEEFYAMAMKESRAEGSIPPLPSSLPVPAFFTAAPSVDSTAAPSVDSPKVPSVDSPKVPSEVHQSHQSADFPPLPAASSTSAMSGNNLAISSSKKNGISNLKRSASCILHPPARKRSSSGTSSKAANATDCPPLGAEGDEAGTTKVDADVTEAEQVESVGHCTIDVIMAEGGQAGVDANTDANDDTDAGTAAAVPCVPGGHGNSSGEGGSGGGSGGVVGNSGASTKADDGDGPAWAMLAQHPPSSAVICSICNKERAVATWVDSIVPDNIVTCHSCLACQKMRFEVGSDGWPEHFTEISDFNLLASKIGVGSKVLLHLDETDEFLGATVTSKCGSASRPSTKVDVKYEDGTDETGLDLMEIPFVLVDSSQPSPTPKPPSQPFDQSVLIPDNISIEGFTLADGGASVDHVAEAEKLLAKDPGSLNEMQKIIHRIILDVQDNDLNETVPIIAALERARTESTAQFIDVMPSVEGRINQGDPGRAEATHHIEANYATMDCLKHRDLGKTFDLLCGMYRNNGCLRLCLKSLPSSLVREDGGDWTSELEEYVNKIMSMSDWNVLVPLVKGDEESELDELCDRLDISRGEYDLFIAAKLALRCKLCLVANGQKLSALYFGQNARTHTQGARPASDSPRGIFVHGGVHHMEVWSTGPYAMGAYLRDEQGTLAMNRMLLSFYKSMEELGISMDGTRFVQRRAGIDGKTPEEIEEDRARLFAARSKGGKATAKRIHRIMNSKMEDVSEDDFALLISRYEGGYAIAERIWKIMASHIDDVSEEDYELYMSRFKAAERYWTIANSRDEDLTDDDRAFFLSRFEGGYAGGYETQSRLKAAKERMAKGKGTDADRLRVKNAHDGAVVGGIAGGAETQRRLKAAEKRIAKGEGTDADRVRIKNAQEGAVVGGIAGGTEAQRRLKAAEKRIAKGEGTEADQLRVKNSLQRIVADVAAAVNKNRATAGDVACDRYDRQQAGNAKKQAETIERSGMIAVTKSTREKQKVTCKCEKCGDLRLSEFTKPAKDIGNDGRRIFVYSVDTKGNKTGEPRIVDGNREEQKKAVGASAATIRSIVNASEEGGLLKTTNYDKRTEDLWLQYEPRPEMIIIAPTCKNNKCKRKTQPIDPSLLRYRDYVSYR